MADIVLINPGDRRQIYQDLEENLSAVEPPFWVAVTAAYLRKNGLDVAVIDSNAENITPEETAARAACLDPLLSVVVVYGSQPSASTQNMTVAGRICTALSRDTSSKVAIGGLHPSALPERTLMEEDVDFVVVGEGPFTLDALVRVLKKGASEYARVPGLVYMEGKELRRTARPCLVRDLDKYLPAGAWDLLPMDRYRAHNWHCFDDLKNRMNYGAIYTSLGCPYSCVFCCINAPFGSPGIRYRSPELVVDEIGLLVKNHGVKNLKIVDELFVLDERHYMSIVEGLIKKGYGLNIWAYARVDTVKPENLKKMKLAGINWLALGIESANPDVRDGASKRMRVRDIAGVVQAIRAEGIRVIGNYIFGLPDDDMETMRETLHVAKELNCEFANFYCAMAYPGSRLYDIAVDKGWKMPEAWHGFSQHSYEMLPLPTKHISAREVVGFRDDAFHEYFEDPGYLEMVTETFGRPVRSHIEGMTGTRLKRRLLEEGL